MTLMRWEKQLFRLIKKPGKYCDPQTTTEEWNRARQNTENTTQLDLPVKDIFAENSANGFDPVTVEGKDFKLNCLPPQESTDTLCYHVLETCF